MGAWGHQPFQNDAAQDWLAELGENPPFIWLQQTFNAVLEETNYIEADAASAAIAAVALLAMISGNRPYVADSLPPGLSAAKIRQKINVDLLARADLSIQKVKDPARSELAQLWQDSPDYAAWLAGVCELEAQLQRPIQAFWKPRTKKSIPQFQTYRYPGIESPDWGRWITIFEVIDLADEQGGNTQIMVVSSGIFAARGTKLGIVATWIDDHHVVIRLRKDIQVLKKEIRIWVGREVIEIAYVEE